MPSSYEKVTRNMVENLHSNVKEGFDSLKKDVQKIQDKNEQMFNHLSTRLPPWASILIGILIALVSAVFGNMI